MNIPNLISCGRILLVPLFVYSYIKGNTLTAAVVLLISGLSDVLDGMIARRFNMVTDLGKILDPVADKLIQAAMMFCLAIKLPQLWYLLGFHIFRELLLGAMGVYVLRSTGLVCGAKWYGKTCTVVIYISMLSLLAMPDMPGQVVNVLLIFCTALIAFCLFMYLACYLRILRQRRII